MISEVIDFLTKIPPLVPPVLKIIRAFAAHEDPVAVAEREAEILAAKLAIRAPFAAAEFTGTKPRP